MLLSVVTLSACVVIIIAYHKGIRSSDLIKFYHIGCHFVNEILSEGVMCMG